jgi:hypothetical protein
MRRGRDRVKHALLVLPLMTAVLLASVCLPVTCSAATMAAGACPDCASTMSHPATGPMMPVSMPMHDQKPATCTHYTTTSIQASYQDSHVRFTQIAAALPAPIAAALPSAPVVRAVAQDPSPPPSIVLTASHLRV